MTRITGDPHDGHEAYVDKYVGAWQDDQPHGHGMFHIVLVIVRVGGGSCRLNIFQVFILGQF